MSTFAFTSSTMSTRQSDSSFTQAPSRWTSGVPAVHAGQETRRNPSGLAVFVSVDAAGADGRGHRRPSREGRTCRGRRGLRSPTTGHSCPAPRPGDRARRRRPPDRTGRPLWRRRDARPGGASRSNGGQRRRVLRRQRGGRPGPMRPSRAACSSAFAAERSPSAPRFPDAPAIACACLAAIAPSPAITAARRASRISCCPSANRSSIRSRLARSIPRRCSVPRTSMPSSTDSGSRPAAGLALDADAPPVRSARRASRPREWAAPRRQPAPQRRDERPAIDRFRRRSRSCLRRDTRRGRPSSRSPSSR